MYTAADLSLFVCQTAAFAALQAMGTVAISADADMGQEAILNLPDVKAALAGTPYTVTRCSCKNRMITR